MDADKTAPQKRQPPEHLAMLFDAVKNDEFLQSDLDHPLVQEAMRHWLGIQRLNHEEAERKFNDDYRVVQTFGKIQNLKKACDAEAYPFPLELVLRGPIPTASSRNPSSGNQPENANGTKASPTNKEPTLLGSALKKPKNEPRVHSKEPAVKFANPPKEMEVRFEVEKNDEGTLIARILRHPLFSMEPFNVAAWWGLQFFAIGVYIASRLV